MSSRNRIDEIIDEIEGLQSELVQELKAKEQEFFYQIHNRRVEFEQEVIEEGRKKIISSLQYLSQLPVLTIVTMPFIWMMIIPALLMDIMVTTYQWICFPIYKIPKVKRSDYVVIDRYNLFYLDKIERINCLYCEYFNGVIGYVREIAARTEQLWCPIKHSRPLQDTHSRYNRFFDFGDYLQYRKELEKRRADFEDIEIHS